jgi:saccharopine dehydrogenase-like NADP-dependent oxidoreductase
MYTLHSEVATLPSSFADKGVQEVSFKIAFEPDFLDKVRFLRDLGLASHDPISVGDAKIAPIQLLAKIAAQQKPGRRIGKLRQYEIVRAVVKGTKGKKKVTIVLDCHTSGIPKWGLGSDVNTGCPPAIVARMITSGEISGAGVFPPEQIVLPKRFFAHLKKRGFRLKTVSRSGWAVPA